MRNFKRPPATVAFFSTLLLFVACRSATAPPCNSGQALVNATVWVQSAAEYRASALQTYATARRNLDLALAESSDRPAAVILDLDETAIDNSAFETRMIERGITYDHKAWLEWVSESAAVPVPGAAEFLAYARSRGVTPFYITNRKSEEEPATRRNLEKLGYPLSTTEDTLLVRAERKEWESSDKSGRREWVASRYRVLLVLGDDLNDFVFAAGKSVDERRALIDNNQSLWGTRWLILPNPMYGSWEKAITGDGTPECESLKKKLDSLR